MEGTLTRETAKRDHSLRRVFRKIIIGLARLYLVPSSLRVRLLIRAGVRFSDPATAFVGDSVRIDDARPDLVTIGRFVRITSGAVVLTHFFDARHTGTREAPFHFTLGGVLIGDYVFIGTNTVIAAPVTIADWAVVGANSVVTSDVPEGAIVVGAPARVVGYREGFQKGTT
jgi:acetyltransferase-like isoleucine patch superfamily enzyme